MRLILSLVVLFAFVGIAQADHRAGHVRHRTRHVARSTARVATAPVRVVVQVASVPVKVVQGFRGGCGR